MTKLKGNTFTSWLLTAFVALGWYSAAGTTFALGRPGQTSIVKPNRKPPIATVNSSGRVEEFSFLIKDFKVEHQDQTNNVNISIQFRYRVNISDSEYPDFRLVAKDVETFLTNYPNEKDYWEIVNKKLTSLILEKYPPITKVTCQIEISPSPPAPYLRSSTVTPQRTSISRNSIPAAASISQK